MKKIIFGLSLVSILFLVFGNYHYKNKVEAISKRAAEEYQIDVKQKQEEHQSLLDKLNPQKNPKQSINDYLHYLSLTKNSIKISAIGSSVTYGAGASSEEYKWLELLKSSLSDKYSNVQIQNRGFSLFTTEDLISEEKLKLVIEDKPDLIIFETCLLNNYGKPITMDKTFEQIEHIVKTLEKEVPKSKILITSPNPSTLMPEEKSNKLGHSYPDYVRETSDFIQGKGWNYINVYDGIMKSIKENKITVKDTLHEDGIHPNDEGYKLWFEILDKGFKEEL